MASDNDDSIEMGADAIARESIILSLQSGVGTAVDGIGSALDEVETGQDKTLASLAKCHEGELLKIRTVRLMAPIVSNKAISFAKGPAYGCCAGSAGRSLTFSRNMSAGPILATWSVGACFANAASNPPFYQEILHRVHPFPTDTMPRHLGIA